MIQKKVFGRGGEYRAVFKSCAFSASDDHYFDKILRLVFERWNNRPAIPGRGQHEVLARS